MNDGELWCNYPEFSWIQGSSLGRVRTIDRIVRHGNHMQAVKGRIIKQWYNRDDYLLVSFSVHGKVVHRQVHRIIASCFLTNYDNLLEVNHKDCNPSNNNVSNLEWVTREENVAYRDKCGHTARNNAPKLPIYAVSLRTHKVSWFESQMEASRVLGVDQSTITKVLKGKYNRAGDYWFTYADGEAMETTRNKFGDTVADKVEKLMNEEIN